MKLNEIKRKKDEMAAYMVDEIEKIIKTFDKREPGSKGEKDAVYYMADVLKQYSDDVKVEPFTVHPGAFMGWIYFIVVIIIASLSLYFFSLPLLAIIVMFLGYALMIGQFVLYRRMIDKLFKKKTSYNITAVKKPAGEVKRRIFFNGHPDSAYEWTFNYYFGGVGFIGHFVISVVGTLYLVAISVVALLSDAGILNIASNTIRNLGLACFVFVPFWIALLWLWNEKHPVDGANDNLTGCYMGISILKALKDEGIELENTEVGVIISGSEEAGLRGAKAWSEAHKGEYDDVETLIFAYDTIHELKYLCVNERDLNLTVKADKRASKLFADAAKEINAPCLVGNVPFGATDSAAFNLGGFKATGITALNHNLQNYYHTRRDTYDNLDSECLAVCYEVSVQALEMFDEGK